MIRGRLFRHAAAAAVGAAALLGAMPARPLARCCDTCEARCGGRTRAPCRARPPCGGRHPMGTMRPHLNLPTPTTGSLLAGCS